MTTTLVTPARQMAAVVDNWAGRVDSFAARHKFLEFSFHFLSVKRQLAANSQQPCELCCRQQRKISLPFVNRLSSAFESLGTDGVVHRFRQSFKRHTMSHQIRTPEYRLIATIVAGALAGCVASCGKATPEVPTAVRVKQVEERQKTDPNFFLKDKSVATPAAPGSNALAESGTKATGDKPGAVTTR